MNDLSPSTDRWQPVPPGVPVVSNLNATALITTATSGQYPGMWQLALFQTVEALKQVYGQDFAKEVGVELGGCPSGVVLRAIVQYARDRWIADQASGRAEIRAEKARAELFAFLEKIARKPE